MLGLFPLHASLGIMSISAHIGETFWRVTAYSSALNQYPLGSLASLSIVHAFSSNVLFRHSTMPLCCGMFGMVISWWVPLSFRYDSNCLPVYSPPLLVLNTLSFCTVCSSSHVSSSLKFWSSLDFSCSPTMKTFHK